MSELFSFGAWVRQRRRALDLTREELAAQIGCAAVTIRHIETDERRPSKQLAARLADSLQLSAEERPTFVQAARGELATDRLAAPAVSVERSIGGALAPSERDTPALACRAERSPSCLPTSKPARGCGPKTHTPWGRRSPATRRSCAR